MLQDHIQEKKWEIFKTLQDILELTNVKSLIPKVAYSTLHTNEIISSLFLNNHDVFVDEVIFRVHTSLGSSKLVLGLLYHCYLISNIHAFLYFRFSMDLVPLGIKM